MDVRDVVLEKNMAAFDNSKDTDPKKLNSNDWKKTIYINRTNKTRKKS